MFEFTQIGWFDPGSKRFCYTDEKEYHSARSNRFQSYTHPVFSIDPETASRLSVQLEPPKNDQPTQVKTPATPSPEGEITPCARKKGCSYIRIKGECMGPTCGVYLPA